MLDQVAEASRKYLGQHDEGAEPIRIESINILRDNNAYHDASSPPASMPIFADDIMDALRADPEATRPTPPVAQQPPPLDPPAFPHIFTAQILSKNS